MEEKARTTEAEYGESEKKTRCITKYWADEIKPSAFREYSIAMLNVRSLQKTVQFSISVFEIDFTCLLRRRFICRVHVMTLRIFCSFIVGNKQNTQSKPKQWYNKIIDRCREKKMKKNDKNHGRRYRGNHFVWNISSNSVIFLK